MSQIMSTVMNNIKREPEIHCELIPGTVDSIKKEKTEFETLSKLQLAFKYITTVLHKR